MKIDDIFDVIFNGREYVKYDEVVNLLSYILNSSQAEDVCPGNLLGLNHKSCEHQLSCYACQFKDKRLLAEWLINHRNELVNE